MPSANPLILLNGGEFSPLIEGQVGHPRYPRSCRSMINMIPLIQGGATRRPPFNFVSEIKNSASRADLIPFVWGATDEDVQAYQIEAGAGYLRFFTDLAQIVAAATDAVISNGDFTSNITGWTDVSTGAASIAHDAARGRMSLVGAAGQTAAAQQQVAISTGLNEINVLKFAVLADGAGGGPGDTVTLNIGTTAGGGEVLADTDFAVGYHSMPFTPASGPVYVRFSNGAAKTLQLDNIAILNGQPLEIGAPYAAGETEQVMWTQSYDVSYWEHPAWPVFKLERRGAVQWSLVEVEFKDGPYLAENTGATTLTPSAATGDGITLTASGTVGINGGLGFQVTDIGRVVRLNEAGTWGWVRITGHTSPTVVTVDVKSTLTNTNAKSAWRIGLWSATTGYPRTGVFHDERLILGPASITAPNRLDGSVVFAPETFAPGANDDDPLSYAVNADEVPTAYWLASAEMLLVGTGAGIGAVQAPNVADVLTPSNGSARVRLYERAKRIRPVIAGAALLFFERHGRRLLEMPTENLDIDGFNVATLTDMAEHITLSGVAGHAWQDQPYRCLWCRRADGRLIGLAYSRPEEMVGWFHAPVAGSFGGGPAVVESVSVIPGEGYDEFWIIVKRTINGATRRYVEVMNAPFTAETAHEDGYFGIDSVVSLDQGISVTAATNASPVVLTLDAATLADGDQVRLSDFVGMTELNGNVYTVTGRTAGSIGLADSAGADIDGSAFGAYLSGGVANRMVMAVSGADHLEGEQVYAHADGATQGPFTVTGASVALDEPAGVIHIGLQAPSTVIPQRIEGGNPEGSARGRRQRVSDLAVHVWRTAGMQYGPTLDNLKPLLLRKPGDAMTAATPLFSGPVDPVSIDSAWGISTEFALYSDSTQPATIVCLVPKFRVETG